MKRTLIAECRRDLELYRVYDPEKPWHTISFATDKSAVKRIAAQETGDPEVVYKESDGDDNGNG